MGLSPSCSLAPGNPRALVQQQGSPGVPAPVSAHSSGLAASGTFPDTGRALVYLPSEVRLFPGVRDGAEPGSRRPDLLRLRIGLWESPLQVLSPMLEVP